MALSTTGLVNYHGALSTGLNYHGPSQLPWRSLLQA